jgi:hypothetical protein
MNPLAIWPLLVIWPVASILALRIFSTARSRLAFLVAGAMLVLPAGAGLALMSQGIDKYGSNAWVSAVPVAIFFGVLLGWVMWNNYGTGPG